jgi:hypothetical protein
MQRKTKWGAFATHTIFIHPITAKPVKITWDYFERFPTPEERKATEDYVLQHM